MTSFIAAGGSGRSTSVIPAVPAAWSVATIAFIRPSLFGRSREPVLAGRTYGVRVVSALMFFPRGGSSHVARALARELPASGWDVTVLSGSRPGAGGPPVYAGRGHAQ